MKHNWKLKILLIIKKFFQKNCYCSQIHQRKVRNKLRVKVIINDKSKTTLNKAMKTKSKTCGSRSTYENLLLLIYVQVKYELFIYIR